MTQLDQDQIIDSCGEHLKSLRETVKTALLAAIVFWWAGLQKEDPIKIFDLTVPLRFAQYIAVLFYLFINLSVLDKLVRIKNLVVLVSDDNLLKLISKLSLHSFFANPYSFFGDKLTSRISSGKGFGVLIIIWWICNASIYSLSRNIFTIPGLLLLGLFLLLGLASIRTIVATTTTMLDRIKLVDDVFFKEIDKHKRERDLITFLCIGIGGVISYLTTLLVGN